VKPDQASGRRRRPHLLQGALIALAALWLVPFAWMLCASLKAPADFFASSFLPWDHLERLTLAHYANLIAQRPFLTWLLNSLFLASVQTVVVVLLSSLGGFALATYRFRGRRAVMALMLATILVPGQVLLPSTYELVLGFGWINSYAAILVPGALSVFGILLFRAAMAGVPDELLHAARIDGAGEVRLWWDIALPSVRPSVGAFTLMSFTGTWNSFLWPQIVLQDENKYHLPIGMTSLMGLPEHDVPYGMLMAGTLLSVLPVVALFALLHRDFHTGVMTGAIKG
jgi:ABC-type glycerol-3-phosphate transport system permease component